MESCAEAEGMTENVLIAGAGIGGLTAALALQARGIDATVIDVGPPSARRRHQPPAARRARLTVGLGEELAGITVRRRPSITAADGTLCSMSRVASTAATDSAYSVHRGRLQMMFLSACGSLRRQRCSGNCELLGFDSVARRVSCSTPAGGYPLQRSCRSGRYPFQPSAAGLHRGADPLSWSGCGCSGVRSMAIPS